MFNRILAIGLLAFSSAIHADVSLKNLHSFSQAEGSGMENQTALLLNKSGTILYGTTEYGGKYHSGTLFKLDLTQPTNRNYTLLYDFMQDAESNPNGRLTLSHDGRYLYGTSSSFKSGAVFQVSLDQTLVAVKILHTFSLSSAVAGGYDPNGDVLESPDGRFLYGVTESAGTGKSGRSRTGVLYRIQLDHANHPITILHSFDSENDGGGAKNLVMSSDGRFLYGTTQYGGRYNCGIVYQFDLINADHPKETILDSFPCGSYYSFKPHSLLLSKDEKTLYGLSGAGYGYAFEVDRELTVSLRDFH